MILKNPKTNNSAPADPLGYKNVEIHYLAQIKKNKMIAIDDFKFKD